MPVGHTVAIDIRYSHFMPAAVTVPAGVPITFVLRNDDPIDHEWIVGDEATHTRHRTGTEPASRRAARPSSRSRHCPSVRTTVTFADAGHLPLHLPPAGPRGLRHGGRRDRHGRLTHEGAPDQGVPVPALTMRPLEATLPPCEPSASGCSEIGRASTSGSRPRARPSSSRIGSGSWRSWCRRARVVPSRSRMRCSRTRSAKGG